MLAGWNAPPAPELFALTARSGNAIRLSAVSPATLAAGLAPGMALADARARCPELVTEPHDPDEDARWLAALARRMRRFTPMVAVDPPHGLSLDISGCAHLFGGEAALVAAVLGDCDFTTRHALAEGAAAARALARYGRPGQALPALPVAALELEADAALALKRAGLKTLGDLTRRPIASLAARLGPDAVMRLRRIMGEAASPIDPLRPVQRVRHKLRFAEPIGRNEDIIAAIEELLHRACSQLEQRHEGARRMDVMLCRADGAERVLGVETSLPSREPARFIRLLGERIDNLADPIDPGFGFDEIRLAMGDLEPLAPGQSVLEGEEEEDADIAALVDRLSTRLGRGQVQRLAFHDSHIPEAAQVGLPAIEAKKGGWPTDTLKPPRPFCLIDPPQKLMVIAEVPDGPPQRFRWKGKLHDVRLAEGPERIASEWWWRKAGFLPGKGGLTRDYYRVEDKEGRRYWLFRHGLFTEDGSPQWYIHGLFA